MQFLRNVILVLYLWNKNFIGCKHYSFISSKKVWNSKTIWTVVHSRQIRFPAQSPNSTWIAFKVNLNERRQSSTYSSFDQILTFFFKKKVDENMVGRSLYIRFKHHIRWPVAWRPRGRVKFVEKCQLVMQGQSRLDSPITGYLAVTLVRVCITEGETTFGR